MFLKHFKISVLVTLITINLTRIEATKCGDFSCEGESECIYSKKKGRLECTCQEGFVANITGNIYDCHQNTVVLSDEGNCLKIGDKCGPEHKCNQQLICIKTSAEIAQAVKFDLVNCTASDEKCHAGEICMGGKCVMKPPTITIECLESLKCLDKCCAENEFCSSENVCILREKPKDSSVIGQCVESQKCLDKCCQENEVCENGNKCVAKRPGNEQCPEAQKCRDKCCNANEKCENEIECIAAESANKTCSPGQICLNTCCKDNEKCSEENECVEIFIECPESQKCLDNCCPFTHICSSNFTCERAFASTAMNTITSTFSSSSSAATECPSEKQCLNTCCQPEEKCSKFNECIPSHLIECIETDICGDNCCPINETCNEDHECVVFIELPTVDVCPEGQQCLDKCCWPHEVCNESSECVARILKKELSNYDIMLPPELSVTQSSFDATVHLVGLKNQEPPPINCAEDFVQCQNKCCNPKQTCSSTGACEDETDENLAARDCEFDQTCAEYGSVIEAKASLAYTIIGLGCLVMVLSFALFKVYAFRRSNRILRVY